MKHFFLIFLLLVTSVALHAQDNYKRGYIITNNNDTVVGWIDYRTNNMNAHVCTFKKDSLGSAEQFLPGQIAGYRFDEEGTYYVTRTVYINGVERTLFVEYLLQGVMSLFFYTEDQSGVRNGESFYFFENESGQLYTVPKRPDAPAENNQSVIVTDQRYKVVIARIFRNEPPLAEDVKKILFSHKSMINITKDYHNLVCTTGEPCIEFETKPDKNYVKTKLGFYGGLQFIKLPNFNSMQACPSIGAQASLSVPRWDKSLSLLLDFSLYLYQKEPDKSDKAVNFMFTLGGQYAYLHETASVRPTIEGGVILLGLTDSFGGSSNFNVCFGAYLAVGARFRTVKEQFVFCSLGCAAGTALGNSIAFPQLKVGFAF